MDRLRYFIHRSFWTWCAALIAVTSQALPVAQAQPSRSASSEAGANAGAKDSSADVGNENRKEAERRYKRALELFAEGSYDASLLELERAYELAPTYRLLYNVALVNVQLNDYVAALKAFETYLAEGGDEIPEARREEVEGEIERLRTRIGYVVISVDQEGSEVSIDDFPVGTTPLPDRVAVNAGRRHIVVTHDGRRQARVVEVAGGDVVDLTFELAAPEAPKAPPPSPTPPPQPVEKPPERSVPWAAWGVTGALAAGTAVSGALALNAHSQQRDVKNRFGATEAELDQAASDVKTLALVTDILLAATVVSGGVSLYLTLKSPTKDDASVDGAKSNGARSSSAKLLIHPTGVAVHVRF